MSCGISIMSSDAKKKEIYTYRAPWLAYSMAWCRRMDEKNKFKMAIGSYKEEYSNNLSIIQLQSNATSLSKWLVNNIEAKWIE